MNFLGNDGDGDEDWFEARDTCVGEDCSDAADDCLGWWSRDQHEAKVEPIPWRERKHVKNEQRQARHRGMHPIKSRRSRRQDLPDAKPPNSTITVTTRTQTTKTRTTKTATTTTTLWFDTFSAKSKKRSKNNKAIFFEDFEDPDTVNRWRGPNGSQLPESVRLITDKKSCKEGHSCLQFSDCGDGEIIGSVFSSEEFSCSYLAPCDVSFWYKGPIGQGFATEYPGDRTFPFAFTDHPGSYVEANLNVDKWTKINYR
jgi:hypothetical protein